jgi:O-antigen ligase
MMLEENRQDSAANLAEHAQSITNITTDASNMERINRWKCALRMFKEKPIFGWGPGTYMFEYAPFQFSYDKTIVSTNAGDKGNAHSEYISPLAESGLIGMLSFLLLTVLVIYHAIRTYRRCEDKQLRILLLTSILALVTYFSHGMLNNFLDTDKASVPFWGLIAFIVSVDLYHNKIKSYQELKRQN